MGQEFQRGEQGIRHGRCVSICERSVHQTLVHNTDITARGFVGSEANRNNASEHHPRRFLEVPQSSTAQTMARRQTGLQMGTGAAVHHRHTDRPVLGIL